MKTIKPKILVTALSATPFSGSEPGKAFNWTLALSKFFEVHVLLLPEKIEKCKESGLCGDWIFHPIDIPGPIKGGIPFYIWYATWCRAVELKCLELLERERYVGLHHPVLGSFRMLPRYDRLGIRYCLGPLGGGEATPRGLLADTDFPFFPLLIEYIRPLANRISVMLPAVRRVVKNASKVLVTTGETGRVLRNAALNSAVVFPDAIEVSKNAELKIYSLRKDQSSRLSRRFRLVFSGRSLWWKGGSTAIRFLDRLLQSGVNASLDIFGDGPALLGWRTLAENLGIPVDRINFHGMVDRSRLLDAYAESHLFVYPTMHDSSSSAIPEAYSMGLPSMTLYCGGTRTATSPETGINFTPKSYEEFFQRGVELVRQWIMNPELWLDCCCRSIKVSERFSHHSIEHAVEHELVPIFRI